MRRAIAITLLFLLLGAAINVAVAWGCGIWMSDIGLPAIRGKVGNGPVVWHVELRHRPGLLVIHRHPFDTEKPTPSWVKNVASWESYVLGMSTDISGILPAWSDVFSDDPQEALRREAWADYERGYGWPWITLRCGYCETELAILAHDDSTRPADIRVRADCIEWARRDGTVTHLMPRTPGDGVRNGVLIAATVDAQRWNCLSLLRVLPLQPVWPAFLASTLVWSMCLFALYAIPRLIRTRLRARRGCCTACGYDLRGSSSAACPECGGIAKSQRNTPAQHLTPPA